MTTEEIEKAVEEYAESLISIGMMPFKLCSRNQFPSCLGTGVIIEEMEVVIKKGQFYVKLPLNVL